MNVPLDQFLASVERGKKLNQITALLAPKTDEQLAEQNIFPCDCRSCKRRIKKFDQYSCDDCGAVGQFIFGKCTCEKQPYHSLLCNHQSITCRVCGMYDDAFSLLNKIRVILAEDTNDRIA